MDNFFRWMSRYKAKRPSCHLESRYPVTWPSLHSIIGKLVFLPHRPILLLISTAGALVVTTVSGVSIQSPSPLTQHFAQTRPKLAYGRQGLDWIVGPGYSFGVINYTQTHRQRSFFLTHIFCHSRGGPNCILDV